MDVSIYMYVFTKLETPGYICNFILDTLNRYLTNNASAITNIILK